MIRSVIFAIGIIGIVILLFFPRATICGLFNIPIELLDVVNAGQCTNFIFEIIGLIIIVMILAFFFLKR